MFKYLTIFMTALSLTACMAYSTTMWNKPGYSDEATHAEEMDCVKNSTAATWEDAERLTAYCMERKGFTR